MARKLRFSLATIDSVVRLAGPKHELFSAGEVWRRRRKELRKMLAASFAWIELAYTFEKRFRMVLLTA